MTIRKKKGGRRHKEMAWGSGTSLAFDIDREAPPLFNDTYATQILSDTFGPLRAVVATTWLT